MTTASALIVAYRHERYIGEAIRSVLAQSLPPDEILVIDDASPDGTAQAARAVGDPRVRVVVQPHRGLAGLSDTYRDGVAAARGDLIAFLEADDRWPADKLAAQVPHFSDPDIVLSHGRYAVIGAGGAMLHPSVGPSLGVPAGPYDARPFVLRASYVMPVTAVARREALLAAGLSQLEGTPHWDHPTFLALSERGRFFHTPRVTGEWRRHGRSATFRLAGADLAGIERSRALALAARARMAGPGLPDPAEIERAWDDAYGTMIWQAARILLLGRRHGEARRLAGAALRRRASPAVRARLLLAYLASVARVDLEGAARLLVGRSVFKELD